MGGHSAGAHLLASLFTNIFDEPLPKANIKGVYLFAGIYDLMPLVDTYENQTLKMDKDEAKRISPLLQSFQKTYNAHFHLIVGDYDSPAFIEQTKMFHEKLKQSHCNVTLSIYPNFDHFKIVEDLNEEHYEITLSIIGKN